MQSILQILSRQDLNILYKKYKIKLTIGKAITANILIITSILLYSKFTTTIIEIKFMKQVIIKKVRSIHEGLPKGFLR
jgi:hypothetical protein